MTDQHPHDHDHDQPPGAGPGPPVLEPGLDPAGKSLSDALLLSFRLLKGIMFLLVVGYLLSGTFSVDANEEAVVTVLGRMEEQPRQPGLQWSPPFPIADRRLVRVKEKKVLELDGFWFKVSEQDRHKLVSEMSARMGGLEPGVDGSLLTGDRNLVHLKLQVNYYIDDSLAFVKNLRQGADSPEAAIAGAVESAAIARLAAVEVDEILRGQIERLMLEVRHRAQQTLDSLGCGIRLDSIITVAKTWPLQTAPAFIRVQQAENEKLQKIEEAKAQARRTLNAAAGPNHPLIADKIAELETAVAAGDRTTADSLDAEITTLLQTVASGEAAKIIGEANSYKARMVQEVQAAARLFEELLPRYRQNARLVRETLWQDAVAKIFSSLSVEQIYVPNSSTEVRVEIGKSKRLQQLVDEEAARKETENK